MTDHDPMLDGITRWDLYVSTKLDVLPVVAVDGEYVLFSDLPALIARVREDEREAAAQRLKVVRDAADVALLGTLQTTRDRVIAAIDAVKEKS